MKYTINVAAAEIQRKIEEKTWIGGQQNYMDPTQAQPVGRRLKKPVAARAKATAPSGHNMHLPRS